MNKNVLINNTTKEERKNIIEGALAISMLDCDAPTDEDMKLFQKYINGEMELDEVREKLIEKYTEI